MGCIFESSCAIVVLEEEKREHNPEPPKSTVRSRLNLAFWQVQIIAGLQPESFNCPVNPWMGFSLGPRPGMGRVALDAFRQYPSALLKLSTPTLNVK